MMCNRAVCVVGGVREDERDREYGYEGISKTISDKGSIFLQLLGVSFFNSQGPNVGILSLHQVGVNFGIGDVIILFYERKRFSLYVPPLLSPVDPVVISGLLLFQPVSTFL